MNDAVIITAMICLTLIALCWISRDNNKKGGADNGNH